MPIKFVKRSLLVLIFLGGFTSASFAQFRRDRSPVLPEDRFKSGAATLRAFIPVADAVRDSIVKFELDGKAVALGAVINSNGMVITKASEIKSGKLTCKLADGRELAADVAGVDDDNDVALVKIKATGLKPIDWTFTDPGVGQWAVTPGIEISPEAVGVVSVPPRKIFPKRAYIGVVLDFNSPSAKIAGVMSGLGAEKAGLKPGDIIMAVNETVVKKSEELSETLRNLREGQMVKLRIQREEKEFETSIKMKVPQPDRRDRQERMNRMGGEISQRAEGFAQAIQHDSVLQPWQCGGPLVNLEGKAIGLNIARAGRVATYALPAELVKQLIDGWVAP